MKIFFGSVPKKTVTPWGGGNVLLSRLHDYLVEKGHRVVFALDGGCDIAYIPDPRRARHVYGMGVPIIQRVGDVGTHGKPELTELLQRVLPYTDTAIFPSEWARNQLKEYAPEKSVVIPNVADNNFFNKKLKVVTHHWSDNPMKGGDIYEKLQRDQEELNVEFTFIGRPSFESKPPTVCKGPLNKTLLAKELTNHDFYLTASRLEAGANHVLEAMACGLPVLYHEDGGSIPEYVGKRGIAYKDYSELYSILSPMKSVNEICEEYYSVLKKVYHESSDRSR